MTLSQYIRDNTSDGTEIADVLIDIMHERLDSTRISHRLTAARLLTIYGHKDADDFIAHNTPDISDKEWGERVRVSIDPDLSSLIKSKTDGGRELCLFLIEVVQGKVESINVGHRVWAANELLNRAFGKSQSRPLPKPPGSKTSRRSTNGTRRKRKPTPEDATFERRIAASRAAQNSDTGTAQHSTAEAVQHTDTAVAQPGAAQPETNPDFDPDIYRSASRCIDPDFDPMRAASDEDYWFNYDGCEDISCPYHGDPEDPDFDPNAHHC